MDSDYGCRNQLSVQSCPLSLPFKLSIPLVALGFQNKIASNDKAQGKLKIKTTNLKPAKVTQGDQALFQK